MSDWLASQLAEVVFQHVAGVLLGYCMRSLRPAVQRALAYSFWNASQHNESPTVP